MVDRDRDAVRLGPGHGQRDLLGLEIVVAQSTGQIASPRRHDDGRSGRPGRHGAITGRSQCCINGFSGTGREQSFCIDGRGC